MHFHFNSSINLVNIGCHGNMQFSLIATRCGNGDKRSRTAEMISFNLIYDRKRGTRCPPPPNKGGMLLYYIAGHDISTSCENECKVRALDRF